MTFDQKKFALLISRTLLGGVALSALLLLSGLAAAAAGLPAAGGLLKAGVLALLLTPAARVGMLVYGYRRGGENYFALASFSVLALLLIAALV